MSKTFCPLPFNHLYIKPDGSYLPCCRFSDWPDKKVEQIQDYDSLDDVLNKSKWLTNIRENMLAGKKVKGCRACYIEEEATDESMRTAEIHSWGDIDNEDYYPPKVSNIEITFGNYCNLACRTCGSSLSTSWEKDDKVLSKLYPDRGVVPRQSVKKEWKPEEFVDVKKLKITGGEPMLHPDFLSFLDTIIASGVSDRMEIQIFTNTSFVPKKHLLERLCKFKEMGIWLSIDGLGDVQEYTRHNSKWDIVEKSVERWFEFQNEHPKNVYICFAPTITLYNVFYVQDMITWWFEKRDEILKDTSLRTNCTWNVATWPFFNDIKHLPNKGRLTYDLKKFNIKLRKKYEKPAYPYCTLIERILDRLSMEAEPDKLVEFTQFNKDLDKLRNQKFIETFPELYEQIKDVWDQTDGKLDK